MSKKSPLGMAAAILSLVLSAACSNAGRPPAVSPLDGVWVESESSAEKGDNSYSIEMLIISGESYWHKIEEAAGTGMVYGDDFEGKIVIKDKELILIPEKGTDYRRGDLEKDELKPKNLSYVLNGEELRIVDNDRRESVLRKSPYRYRGDMRIGSQKLTIRLTIASFDASGEVHNAYYQYYNQRRDEYGDPIMLSGRLQERTLTLYEMEPKDPAIKRASFTFPDYSIFSRGLKGVWQDLRKGKEANKSEPDLSLDYYFY